MDDMATAICLSLQQYDLAEDSQLFAARKNFFMLIEQGRECETQHDMVNDHHMEAKKKLRDQWTHVNQQIAQTELDCADRADHLYTPAEAG